MKLAAAILTILISTPGFAQRKINNLPDLPGYVTLKADLHVHTVFSDGEVWPSFRVDEAAREGIDVIAITDHIEYRPHDKYLNTSHNTSYEVARDYAKDKNIIVIKGVEITREMPTGHFNALFVTDTDKLTDKDFLKTMGEAVRQGAFIFWNHPGWKKQQPDGVPKFHDIHNELYKRGWLHGIEYYNTKCAWGFVLDWCNEKNLTVLSNSDVHIAASDFWEFSKGGSRPVTLLFAKDRSEAGVRDALVNGRTLALYSGDSLAGKKEWAEAFFRQSIRVEKPTYQDEKTTVVEITNTSSLPFYLVNLDQSGDLKKITVAPGTATRVSLKKGAPTKGRFQVRNILIGNNRWLEADVVFME